MTRAAADLARLNALEEEHAVEELLRVCGSRAWALAVARRRPFADPAALESAAEAAWDALDGEGWLEAIAAHPRIGESRTAAGAEASAWARAEQARMGEADERAREDLAAAQRRYEERFGHGFLICATGLSAETMLAACEARTRNDPPAEIEVAAQEERKIGRLRIAKLLGRS